ncbi:hypothetical protein A6V39_00520 [Candidatus Mycoplasma haematobovis]|uniref:type I site-specific deoxyribonuclease n=1 Tax=Candidatus Mycoplasma haematobovis TaxID=432608 RepID=A0A1A9QEH6_9MOLU|nr:type I restriction endonuclease [Candidatus Mycoplasma haematobovis]OAL10534.1 hypothetical protein A6V39_00520 [Candidatus Mycoplasma haematobovis]
MEEINEFELENLVINILKYHGYQYTLGDFINRNDKSEIILEEDLINFLSDSQIASEVINSLKELPIFFSGINSVIWDCIQQGIWVSSLEKLIPLIDFKNVEKNHFRVVNQLSINTGRNTRRPDVIIYINGLPLIVFELKSPKRDDTILNAAYRQLTLAYLSDIPELFKYNLFLVISNGYRHKYGIINDYLQAWHTWDNGYLSSFLEYLFDKHTLLHYIKNSVYTTKQGYVNLTDGATYGKIYWILNWINVIIEKANNQTIPIENIQPNYQTIMLLRSLSNSWILENYSIIYFVDKNDKWLNNLIFESNEFISFDSTIKGTLEPKKIYLLDIQDYIKEPCLITDSNNLICISHKEYKNVKFNWWTAWKMKIKHLLKRKNTEEQFYYEPNYKTLLDYIRFACPNAIHLIGQAHKCDRIFPSLS